MVCLEKHAFNDAANKNGKIGAAPVAASPEKAGEPTPTQIDEKEQQVPNGGGDLAQDAAAESEQDDFDKDLDGASLSDNDVENEDDEAAQAEPPHDSMQKVEDMQAWEREERSRVQKMKVGELKDMLQALDEQTYKRCKGYKKDMLVMEVMSLKREVKLSASKVEPEAKRRKV